MYKTKKIFGVTTFLTLAGSAFSLTLDTSGITGPQSYSDSNGSNGTVSISHISSNAAELQFMVDDIQFNGRSVNLLGDLNGTLKVNDFGIADYGHDDPGAVEVLGMYWDMDATFANVTDYSHLLYNNVDFHNGSGFYSKDYGDNSDPAFPFNPTPDYRDTDGDTVADTIHIDGNYGWVFDYNTQFTDTRYILFGYVSTDGQGDQTVNIADGVKMTLNATVVPEPSTFAILGLGSLAVIVRRKCRSN